MRALRRVASAELSLDAPLDKSDRDSASFGERFSGMDDADIEEDVEDQARREFLEKMFERYLTERERKILVLYYGLDDGEEMTLEEIGSLLGVTRERIRQIRNRAFDKLRASPDGERWKASGAPPPSSYRLLIATIWPAAGRCPGPSVAPRGSGSGVDMRVRRAFLAVPLLTLFGGSGLSTLNRGGCGPGVPGGARSRDPAGFR